jgi:hypothetical protein
MAQSQPLDSNTPRESQVSNTLSRELLDSDILIDSEILIINLCDQDFAV